MTQADGNAGEHERNTQRGITFLWVLAIGAGFAILFGLTQWGLLSDVPVSEIGWVAVGTANGIGLIAVGGWNAIGLVSIGGANSIGLISFGGINSVGVVAFGGFAAYGLITIGGVNSTGPLFRASIYTWSPSIHRRGSA